MSGPVCVYVHVGLCEKQCAYCVPCQNRQLYLNSRSSRLSAMYFTVFQLFVNILVSVEINPVVCVVHP